jgi:hypothetical protein
MHIQGLYDNIDLHMLKQKIKELEATKPWVDLTDEDIGDAYVAWDNTDGASFADFARLIEAQLRKKNG